MGERGILAFSRKLTISPIKTQRNQGHSESAQWKVFRMPKAFQFVRLTVDGFVKSPQSRHPGESRGPEVLVFPGFRLSPE
jgi:hypothetical protein